MFALSPLSLRIGRLSTFPLKGSLCGVAFCVAPMCEEVIQHGGNSGRGWRPGERFLDSSNDKTLSSDATRESLESRTRHDLMSDPPPTSEAPPTVGEKFSGTHQEIGTILDEVEQIYHSQPTEWLLLEPIGSMVCHLWYEDVDEFEDAVGGSFEEFMRAMPHVELRTNEQGKTEFKVLMPDPDAAPVLLTLNVKSREDLWRVLFKAPDALVRIPHMEFEIGCDEKRKIDSVYNHISHAAWNLSSHIRGRKDLDSVYVSRVNATIETLEKLLDVDEPYQIIVDDYTGASAFKPDEGVEKMELGHLGSEEYAAQDAD